MSDIIDRLENVAGPWSDRGLAADARKEIQRLRAALKGIAMITDSDEVYRKAKKALGEGDVADKT